MCTVKQIGKSYLDEKLVQKPTIQSKNEIEIAVITFTESICEAIDVSVPVVQTEHTNKINSKTLSLLTKVKNYFRRKYQRIRQKFFFDIYNFLTKLIRKTLYSLNNMNGIKIKKDKNYR